jgi:hypothetical protein
MRSRQRRGRLLLIALVLMFALPAVIAKLILSQNWYNPGITNKGRLIEPRVTYPMLGMSTPDSWQLAYLVPAQCKTQCRAQLNLLQQSYQALGRYKSRVKPVLLITVDSDTSTLPQGMARQIATDVLHRHISMNDYLIVDPLGQLVMAYTPQAGDKQLSELGRYLLSDLRKLLKLSRVG